MCACLHVCVRAYVCVHMCACVCTCMHACLCAHIWACPGGLPLTPVGVPHPTSPAAGNAGVRCASCPKELGSGFRALKSVSSRQPIRAQSVRATKICIVVQKREDRRGKGTEGKSTVFSEENNPTTSRSKEVKIHSPSPWKNPSRGNNNCSHSGT